MMEDWAGTENILASQSGTISTAGLQPSTIRSQLERNCEENVLF